jgi:very-short-patch-repair endonuclease
MGDRHTPKIALARAFRKDMTLPERLVWERIKGRSDGLVFRRQHAVGPYILDFYCFRARLAVEVDGGVHGDEVRQDKDRAREDWLRARGIEVYRITAADVLRDADAAADGVLLLAAALAGKKDK